MSRRVRLSAEERRARVEEAALALFAERGYRGTAMGAVASRAGVTPPVLYDHVPSKHALHRRLLERTRDELLGVWRTSLAGTEPGDVRVPRAFAAWAEWVQANPDAARLYFRDTEADAEAEAVHARIRDEGRAALAAILAAEPAGAALLADRGPAAVTMAAETIRAGLAGLALWWCAQPDRATREEIVATAVDVLWAGLRGRDGRGGEPPRT